MPSQPARILLALAFVLTTPLSCASAADGAAGDGGAHGAHEGEGTPEAAENAPEAALDVRASEALLALKRAILSGEHAEEVAGRGVTSVFSESRVPADDAVRAWREAASGRGNAPERVLRAEAALLGLAAANAREAASAGAHDEARAWLRVVLARVPWEARALPAAPLLGDRPDAATGRALAETLDAALAMRAREAVVQSALLAYSGRSDEALSVARGSEVMLALLVPDASSRLPPALGDAFEGNVTRVGEQVRALPTDRSSHILPALLAPLAALEYDRDVEPLDEFASRNVDAAFAAARAAAEEPEVAPLLAEQAVAQYAADRAGLFLRGEGTLEASDAAYRAFAAAGRNATRLAGAAAEIHDALRTLALLERGIVVKVETGGVQPGREHAYTITLVRPPLTGVASFELSLEYDPDVVRLRDAKALAPLDAFGHAATPGELTFWGEGRIRRSVHLATFVVEATGPPNATSALAVARADLRGPHDEALAVFRLRDGSATVAYVELGATQEDTRSTPAPLPLSLLGATVVAVAMLRRPRRPGDGGASSSGHVRGTAPKGYWP